MITIAVIIKATIIIKIAIAIIKVTNTLLY